MEYSMFHCLGTDGCKGYRPVIRSIIPLFFLAYWTNVCFFQCNVPEERDFVKMTFRTGEISSAQSLSTNGGISSGPLALFILSSDNNWHIPSTKNAMSGISGMESSVFESKLGIFV